MNYRAWVPAVAQTGLENTEHPFWATPLILHFLIFHAKLPASWKVGGINIAATLRSFTKEQNETTLSMLSTKSKNLTWKLWKWRNV